MDTEKSNSSSFEDLSLSNDLKEPSDSLPINVTDNTEEKSQDDVMDIIGTGQLTKKVSLRLQITLQYYEMNLLQLFFAFRYLSKVIRRLNHRKVI